MRLLKSIRNLLGNYQLKSGIYHYYRGEAKQAIEYLTRALQAPDSTEPDRRMALYYMTQTHISAAEKFEEAKEMVKAVEEYREALALTPDYPDIHFRMGALYARFELAGEAIESYRHAIELHPDYLEARIQLAFLLLQQGRREEAEAEFAAGRELAVRAIQEPYTRAIEALGAQKDGIIRHFGVRKDGTPRDTVMYSILASEWPDVRRHLDLRLARRGIAAVPHVSALV